MQLPAKKVFGVGRLALKPTLLYGVRRLNPDYSGPLLRVRRGSDNAERDIYFDVAGNLDWPDLLAFANPSGTYQGPLDGVSVGVTVAYGLRRLRSGYTGSAVTVRRNNGDTQDIGFTASGELNVAALLAFCGSGMGYVTRWFDQSGNGRDVLQATQSLQGTIVANGVLVTRGGRPAVDLVGGCYYEGSSSATWMNVANYTLNAVAQLASIPSGLSMLFGTAGNTTNAALHWGWRSGTVFTVAQWGNDADYTTTATTALTIHTATKTGTTGSQLFSNGTSLGTVVRPNATLSTTGALLLGAGFSVAGNGWNGSISEAIAYPSVLSSTDRAWLEHSQAQYFGLASSVANPAVPHSSSAGSAFVAALYEQSGNAQHVTQASAAQQPCIVSLGALQLLNNRPAMAFAGGQFLRRTGAATFTSTGPSFSAVGALWPTSGGSLGILSLAQGTASQNDWNSVGSIAAITRQGVGQTLETVYNGGFGVQPSIPAYRTGFVANFIYPPGSATLGHVNGTLTTGQIRATSIAATVITIGARNDGTAQWTGLISEVSAFTGALSDADRSALNADQATYYGITFTC